MLLLGVDGGGTSCRARLADREGTTLAEGLAGPANLRFGADESLAQVRLATDQCLDRAGLSWTASRIVACLALAGASDLVDAASLRGHPHPFAHMIVTSDARAACVGAHGGRDGGIIVVGTGSVGWAIIADRDHRVGGWGFPVSDEGSGAWLGCEAVRQVLWAIDGLTDWTNFLREVFERFDRDPRVIVRWMTGAHPRDFGELAPTVAKHASQGDPAARRLMQRAAEYIDAIAKRVIEHGVSRLALVGGLAGVMTPLLASQVRKVLVQPEGDALAGALRLAGMEARKHEVSF